jgi:hypothetical protein
MLEIFDARGALMYRQLNMTNNWLNIGSWRTGMYFIIINNGRHRLKLMKQ